MKKTWQKLFIMFLVFMMCVSVVAVFSFTPTDSQAAPGIVWIPTQRTTTAFNKAEPSQVADASKIYYAWHENDGSNNQIWTASMNIDGTEFSAIQRTSTSYSSNAPKIDLQGTKLYVTWHENDGSNYQINTASLNTDGTGWSIIHSTSDATDKYGIRMKANGTKIYHAWYQNNQIYTSEMNNNGSGFLATQQTNTGSNHAPDLEIYNNQIYIVWSNYATGNIYNTMLATANLDGTNWVENSIQSANWNSNTTDQLPEIDIDNTGNIIIADIISNGANNDLVMGLVNSNLDGWSQIQLLDSTPSTTFSDADVSIYDDIGYVIWTVYDTVNSEIDMYTATLDLDDLEWRPTKQREQSLSNIISCPRILTNIDNAYVVWQELVSTKDQIWTAFLTNESIIEDSTYVSASVPTTLTFTSTPVTSGTPCPNSGGNADISTTGSTVDFANYTGGEDKLGCQEIAVTTNATNGYVTTMQIDQALTNSTSDEMDSFAGSSGSANTWTTPEVWTSPVAPNDSYFGWTTDDTTDYSKFASNKYAAFVANETPYEVATEDGPVVAETNYITFRLEVGANQEAGIYTGSVMYITTATY